MAKAAGKIALYPLVIALSWQINLGVQIPSHQPKNDLDIRVTVPSELLREPTLEQLGAAEALRRELPGTHLRWDGLAASPKWLAAPVGKALTAPSALKPEAAARTFLKARAALFGLTVHDVESFDLTSVVPAPDGGTHLYFTQRVGALEVYGARINITLRPDGAVRHLGSRVYKNISQPSDAMLSAAEAVSIAAMDVYPDREFKGKVLASANPGSTDRKTIFDEQEFGRPPQARLVLFPERDLTRLAWEVRIAEPGLETDYRILIDACDGRILARHNMTFYASARILMADHPEPQSEEWAPEQHQLVGIPASTPESPQGWLGSDDSTLAGNNATSHLLATYDLGLSAADGIYDYSFNTNESALTNAWYWVNEAHDRFYYLGFDEAAGNFQLDNFGLGGNAGDPVQVLAKATSYASLTPIASMSATVDGDSPWLSFGWRSGCRFCADHNGNPEDGGDRSCGFMRDALFHEYAHGVTVRRVGGPSDDSCLTGIQSGVMAEGWSILFAASLFDDPVLADYNRQGQGGVDDLRHDLSYSDLCELYELNGEGRCRSSQDSMIWSGALWELRQSMIALDQIDGLNDFHELAVEALASVPCHPTMLDGRDAILAADTILFGSSHHQVIWNVFANRGMGTSAVSWGGDDEDPVAASDVPGGYECAAPSAPTGMTASAEGDNVIRLEYSASGASAVEVWRDDLYNPADSAIRVGFTTNLVTYLDSTVQGDRSYRYHLVAMGSGGLPCRGAKSSTADATATGGCNEEFPLFIPNLTVSDGDPNCAITLDWDAAVEACPGADEPIVYNIYREETPGFLPSDRLLVGRTASTSFVDVPPEVIGTWFNTAPYYLVIAQHGTLDDPPDHRDRGPSQVMQWAPGLPTLGRTTTHFWDFDDGEQGWSGEMLGLADPNSAWVIADPSPTFWGDTLLAPDEAAGGTGMAWVSGDAAGGPSTVASHNCEEETALISPVWDATDGSTILSFDYWARPATFEPVLAYVGLFICVEGQNCIVEPGLWTTQRFNGPGRYGWQRIEVDLAAYSTPIPDMQVRFACIDGSATAEFGIDNVRIERATVCSTSDLLLNNVIVDDTPIGWGNGNGHLEPGEIARLSVELLNEGSATALTPAGTVWTQAPGAVVLDADAIFPDIPPMSVASSLGDGFTVAAPTNAECFGTVVYEFVFADASGERSTALWSPEYGNAVTDVLFEDSFRTDKGWMVSGAGPLQGQWVRVDPTATYHNSDMANPEDCATGADRFCYVTGNEGPAADYDDVDPVASAVLRSPSFDVEGYKRVSLNWDMWFYDNQSPSSDNSLTYAVLAADDASFNEYPLKESTTGWEAWWTTVTLNPLVPLGTDMRLSYIASDAGVDNIVEAGIDNVVVEGDRQVCDPIAINPPNMVGDALTIGKSSTDAELQWIAPVVDATHDATVYYAVYASVDPDSGFSQINTPMITNCSVPLTSHTNFYRVTAVNGGGTSGEEP